VQPNLAGLSPEQRSLWPMLAATPDDFVLYGGVAIALRLAHRHSADFDFFTRREFDPQRLYQTVPYLPGSEVLQMDLNTLTCRLAGVKVSFFGLPTLGSAEAPERAADTGLQLASLLDLAGTKTSVIQKRAACRDYLDLDALLTQGGVDLLDALVAGRHMYGSMFSPQVTLKALTFFDDGDLHLVPMEVRERLGCAVEGVDWDELARRVRRP
jgi:hypothetical protein